MISKSHFRTGNRNLIYRTSEKNTLAFLKCSFSDKTHCLIQFLPLASCSIFKAPQDDSAVPDNRQRRCPASALLQRPPALWCQELCRDVPHAAGEGSSSGVRGTSAGHCSLPPAETGHAARLSCLWVNCYTGMVLIYNSQK